MELGNQYSTFATTHLWFSFNSNLSPSLSMRLASANDYERRLNR